MHLTSHQEKNTQTAWISDHSQSKLGQQIAVYLKSYDIVLIASKKPPLSKVDYAFFICQQENKKKVSARINVFISTKKQLLSSSQSPEVSQGNNKYIYLKHDSLLSTQLLDRLLWFSFSSSKEIHLSIHNEGQKKIHSHHHSQISHHRTFPLRFFIGIFILFLIFFHVLWIPFISFHTWKLSSVAQLVSKNKYEEGKNVLHSSSWSLLTAEMLYQIPCKTLLFFSLSSLPDSIFEINRKGQSLLNTTFSIQTKGSSLARLILKKNKSSDEILNSTQLINSISKDITSIQSDFSVLSQSIPPLTPKLKKIRTQLIAISDMVKKYSRIYTPLSELILDTKPHTYILLFANNMELRPGGGFIGSFGVVTLGNASIQNLTIYDVYDADGQLKAHVEPPDAIRTHLQQPHWFLRDSAFSGDFPEDYRQALFFLEKEMGFKDISGGILITTTAIKSLLNATGPIRLSDFQETITPENFYLKAQLYAEKDFFPGSTQKKDFLGSVSRHLLIQLETSSLIPVANSIKQSLDEKQLVLFSSNSQLQELFDEYMWSGRLISPSCPSNLQNCIPDYFVPLEANVGVNKSNAFIQRSIETKVRIKKTGQVSSLVTLRYTNTALPNSFPGGTYKNYLQLLLPAGITLNSLSKNGTRVDDIDTIESSLYSIYGFLFELPPQESASIQVEYTHPKLLSRGKGYYQLVLQKQIGTPNSDFTLLSSLPTGMYLINQNFTPLVKQSQLMYTTQLSTDKIFFIELLQE